MSTSELNISNLILWYLLCTGDDESLITPEDADWPQWLSKEPIK